jgi:putative membrane protein
MERGYFLKALVVLSIIWLAGCAGGGISSMKPSDFLTEAAEGSMAEIQLASLALTRTQNPEVRAFAQQMITDHGKASDEIKPIAAKKSITLPLELSSANKSLADKLTKLSGAEFEREYVKAMVEDHEKDVKAFQTQSQGGTDADVKDFATKTLPTLEHHLQMARELQNKMK